MIRLAFRSLQKSYQFLVLRLYLPVEPQLHGKQLSFNNINDTNSALDILKEFGLEKPTVVAVKHANPSNRVVLLLVRCLKLTIGGNEFQQKVSFPLPKSLNLIAGTLKSTAAFSSLCAAVFTQFALPLPTIHAFRQPLQVMSYMFLLFF